MNLFRNPKQYSYQPKAAITFNRSKLLVPIIIFIVIAEIMLLLVAPLAYFGLTAPKPEIKLFQTYPLTNSQIRAAWPNLPNAQEIVKSGVYGFYNTNDYIILPNSTASTIYLQTPPHWWDNSSLTLIIENETETNIPNTLNGGIIPVGYHIYLQSNATMWIEVPMTILDNSKHPPVIPSEANNGFLRTNMPTIYGSTAIVIISATIALGVCYIVSIRHRTKQKLISINGQ